MSELHILGSYYAFLYTRHICKSRHAECYHKPSNRPPSPTITFLHGPADKEVL